MDEKSPLGYFVFCFCDNLYFSGLIDWHSTVILGAATAVGGVFGGHYSTQIKNTSYLRVLIMLVGLSLSVIFFVQNYF